MNINVLSSLRSQKGIWLVRTAFFIAHLFFNHSMAQITGNLKPGDMSSNAKIIDADRLYPFNGGAAIIQKGSSTALIDKNGNILIPYNTYSFVTNYDLGTNPGHGGGFFFTDNGIINSKGKTLVDRQHRSEWSLSHDINFLESYNDKSKTVTYMDVEGRKYIISNIAGKTAGELSEHMILVRSDGKYGYKSLNNEIIARTIYDDARSFSDGMALVGKKNQVGEMKYGFIDKTGKEVIPLTYSIMPEDFHAGLAKVRPKDNTEFEYAFIGKDGKIVIKFTSADNRKYSGEFIPFGNQLYVTGNYIMNSDAGIVSQAEFLGSFGVKLRPGIDKEITYFPYPGVIWEFNDPQKYNDGKTRFIRQYIKQDGNSRAVGFIDLKTKNVVEAAFFSQDHFGLYFDPVSKLAYARTYLGKNHRGGNIYREGYINEEGIFVIVKGEASKF